MASQELCSIKSHQLESRPTAGVSGAQVTLAAVSMGKVVKPAGVQAGQLCSAIRTVLGPQRGCCGNTVKDGQPETDSNPVQNRPPTGTTLTLNNSSLIIITRVALGRAHTSTKSQLNVFKLQTLINISPLNREVNEN